MGWERKSTGKWGRGGGGQSRDKERERCGKEEGYREKDEDGWKSGTLSLRWTLVPALRSDSVVATSPLSAEKKRADHPVLCDGEDKDSIYIII